MVLFTENKSHGTPQYKIYEYCNNDNVWAQKPIQVDFAQKTYLNLEWSPVRGHTQRQKTIYCHVHIVNEWDVNQCQHSSQMNAQHLWTSISKTLLNQGIYFILGGKTLTVLYTTEQNNSRNKMANKNIFFVVDKLFIIQIREIG